MKAFFYLILAIVAVIGGISAFWWVAEEKPIDEQIDSVKSMLSSSVDDTAASNTAESASKLGKVLKQNYNEAQDAYQESMGSK